MLIESSRRAAAPGTGNGTRDESLEVGKTPRHGRNVEATLRGDQDVRCSKGKRDGGVRIRKEGGEGFQRGDQVGECVNPAVFSPCHMDRGRGVFY